MQTLTSSDLRNPSCSARIAAKLAVFHRLDMGAPRTATVWPRMRAWLHTALEVASPLAAAEFCLAELEEETAELEAKLGGVEREGGEAIMGESAARTVPKAGSGVDSRERQYTTGAGTTVIREKQQTAVRSQWGIGFCHNDLQYGNLMADERTGAITIIVSRHIHMAVGSKQGPQSWWCKCLPGNLLWHPLSTSRNCLQQKKLVWDVHPLQQGSMLFRFC